jgi:hypothetical protein
MAAEQHSDGEPAPLVPPTQAGDLPPLQRITVWPKKLGIVSIVFAVLGAATGALTLVSILALRYDPQVIDKVAKTDAQKEFMRSPLVQTWLTASSISTILSIGLAVMLLVCAIGLIRRRPWSIKGLFIWAVLKVILEVAAAGLEYVLYAKISQAINQGLLESADVPGMFRLWSVNAMVFSLAIGCALAVFVLIWLARTETREEVAAWQ